MSFVADIDTLCTLLHSGEIARQTFIDECARLTCAAVGCSRSGLWVFSEGPSGRVLRCLGMYDRASEQMVQVEDRLQEDSGAYFSALQEAGNVVAIDAKSHPATRGFYEDGLRPQGVVSLMSAAFSLNGELFGAFTCSQVSEPARWTARQLTILTRIGSRATLALASASPHQLDTFLGNL
ncbi:MAG: GAF domain-containing protein [Burkholderiales bacterium]